MTSQLLHLTVKTLTGQSIPVELMYDNNTTLVLDLKHKLHQQQGDDFQPGFQRLIHAGRELHDEDLLASYNVQDGSVVHLVLKRRAPVASNEPGPPQPEAQPQQLIDPGHNMPYGFPGGGNPYMDLEGALLPQVRMLGNANVDPARVRTAMQLSKIVKLFAIIDVVFLILWSMNKWYLSIGIPLALCGYFGARNFKRPYIFVYMFFMVLSISFRIYTIVTNLDVAMMLLGGLGIIVELFIMNFTWKFQKLCAQITADEREQLRVISRIGSFM